MCHCLNQKEVSENGLLAVYPGTFDPITYGHLDVIERASRIFDFLIVAVAENKNKSPLFTLDERIELVRAACKGFANVKVEGFGDLLVEYVKRRGAKIVVRGLRAVSDFEFEFQLALTNRRLDGEIETIFLMPRESFIFLSSRMVKEISMLGGDVSEFVPPEVERALRKKFGR